MNKLAALILAGGKGKRMGPLCYSRPKPALPFAANYRVIDFCLSNCINSGISEMGVLTSFQRSYMGSYLKRWGSTNCLGEKLTILEPTKGAYVGTADSVYQNLDYLISRNIDTVLVLAADHIYKMDYSNLIESHLRAEADLTIGTTRVPIQQARLFGNVFTDSPNRIIDFIEKPNSPKTDTVSMGIYVFKVSTLYKRLVEDADNPKSLRDFGHSIIPQMILKDKVYAHEHQGYWQDIGNPEAYHRASLDIIQGKIFSNINDTWPVYGCEVSDKMAENLERGNCINSIIAPKCMVKGRVENSILGPGVWVGEGSVIKNSVIMGNVSIGQNSLINNAILDESTVVGNCCKIGTTPNIKHHGSELVVLEQNTRVASDTDVICRKGELIHLKKTLNLNEYPFMKLLQPSFSR